jgi:hypothetical protein
MTSICGGAAHYIHISYLCVNMTHVRKTGSQSNKIKTNAEIKHRRYTIQ